MTGMYYRDTSARHCLFRAIGGVFGVVGKLEEPHALGNWLLNMREVTIFSLVYPRINVSRRLHCLPSSPHRYLRGMYCCSFILCRRPASLAEHAVKENMSHALTFSFAFPHPWPNPHSERNISSPSLSPSATSISVSASHRTPIRASYSNRSPHYFRNATT